MVTHLLIYSVSSAILAPWGPLSMPQKLTALMHTYQYPIIVQLDSGQKTWPSPAKRNGRGEICPNKGQFAIDNPLRRKKKRKFA